MLNPDNFYFNIFDDGVQSYIKSEDIEGNYTILSPSGLNYYDSKTEETVQYNRKIAFGTAEHGETVDLSKYNFENIPSINVNPKVAPLYSKDYELSRQKLKTGYSNLSKNGFTVECQLKAEEFVNINENPSFSFTVARTNSDQPVAKSASGTYASGEGNIRAKFYTELRLSGGYGESGTAEAVFELYEYVENGDNIFVKEYHSVQHTDKDNNLRFVADTGINPAKKYVNKITLSLGTLYTMSVTLEIYKTEFTYGAEEEILTGSVNWLAIE